MVLVDSSSWIESLREAGRVDVRQRVQGLLASGRAVWCNLIHLELWNGASGKRQKHLLRELEKRVFSLPIDDEVWELAIELADKARVVGLSVPADDLIILACARRHGVSIEHCDEHFDRLESIA